MHRDVMIEKALTAASSQALILSILRKEDSYGYEIIQNVRKLTSDEMRWTDSMLYPVLHRLENSKLLRSYWRPAPNGRKRKYYAITKRGLAALREKRRQWDVASSALNALWMPADV